MKSALKSQLTSSKIIGSMKKDQKDSRETTVKFITNGYMAAIGQEKTPY